MDLGVANVQQRQPLPPQLFTTPFIAMSNQSAADTMDRALSTFLEGAYTDAEGNAMIKELVRRLSIELLVTSLIIIQVKYRVQVVAKTAGTTPLIRHAFDVLKTWHQAKSGDAVPWQHVKNGTMYVPPPADSPALEASVPLMSSAVPVVSAPRPLSTVPPTTPTSVPAVPEVGGPAIPPVASLAPLIPRQAHPTPEESTHTIATVAFPAPHSRSAPSGLQEDDVMLVDSEQEMRRDKGKSRQMEVLVAEKGRAPESKRRHISSKMVAAHHLATEGESTPKPKTSAQARITPSQEVMAPDQLWKTPAERPTQLCDNCGTKGYAGCWTTALQIACSACHTGKTKCSYSASRIARREQMIAAGELPGKKGTGKKKVQDGESEFKAKGRKVVGKRKRQGDNADETSAAETMVVGPGSAAQPWCLETEAPSPLATTAGHPVPGRIPTVTGLQREVQDLRALMATLMANQEKLMNDNIMMRGWVEVLMELKEAMLVSVPALQAELRGLSTGMELERMKAEVAALQNQLAHTNARLSQSHRGGLSEDGSASGTRSSSEHETPEEAPAPFSLDVPTSSMFVPPSELRESSRGTASVEMALHTDDVPRAASPMAVDVASGTPASSPAPGVIHLPTSPTLTAAPADSASAVQEPTAP
jgi:hypothetical protein